MTHPWWWLERPVRQAFRWSAARVSDQRRDEIAQVAWLACVDAARRRGAAAFVRTTAAELADILSAPLKMRAGLGPSLTLIHHRSSFQGSPVTFLEDFRRAGRRLRSHPATLALSIGMLALAIGVTTTMFTVLDALVLHPVPFRDAGRLTGVVVAKENAFMNSAPAAALRAWQDSGVFAGVEAAIQSPVELEGGDGLVSKGGARVTPGLLELLGVRPVLGRTFAAGEGRDGTADRILLSEELWVALFNRDPGIVGRVVRVSGVPTEVVGVLPAAFRFPYSNSMVWRPIDFRAPPPSLAQRRPMVFARLKPGMPEADALRLADEAARGAGALQPGEHARFRPIAAGMLDPYSRRAVLALSIGVGLVFLVLCANAMNLMLTRFSARRREFGVCSALGASRGRLLREALAETALVGAAAAAGGLALAMGLVKVATGYLPAELLTRTLTPVEISGRAILATSLLAFVAAAIAGITPALMATRIGAADALRGTARGGTDERSHRRLTRGLLVAEVALAAALLAGAGQLVRTFVNLTRADRGLNAEGIVTGWVALPAFAFPDRAGRLAFAGALDDRLKQLPGVQQVSLSGGVPPGGGNLYFGAMRSDEASVPSGKALVHAYSVSGAFFDLFGIRLLAGRTFSAASSPDEIILGEQLAKRLFPSGAVVGRSFTLEGRQAPFQVVGVVREIRSPSLDPLLDEPEMYHPLFVEREGRVEASTFGTGNVFVALRCGASCPGADVIGRAIREVSAQAMIVRLGPMEEAYLKELARPRAAAALAAIFATVALLASAGGLFGVLSAAVARRRREFGIRVALGIAPDRLTRLVLADASRLAAIGVAAGVAGAWVLSRVMTSLTYGVSPADPITWAAVFGSVATAVLLAAWGPSRQAARVSPSELLRAE
jgi:putative ABC transport system permease protein